MAVRWITPRSEARVINRHVYIRTERHSWRSHFRSDRRPGIVQTYFLLSCNFSGVPSKLLAIYTYTLFLFRAKSDDNFKTATALDPTTWWYSVALEAMLEPKFEVAWCAVPTIAIRVLMLCSITAEYLRSATLLASSGALSSDYR